MDVETLLEEILLLDRDRRARLWRLVVGRPSLRRELEERLGAATGDEEEIVATPDSDADYLIIWDGGSKGNPGKGYGSYRITAPSTGKSRVERLEFPGRVTNNEAEYLTLISALDTLASRIRERGRAPADYSLDLRGDSLLVVNQVGGRWKAKDERMAGYRDRVRALLTQFGSHTLSHHGRSESVDALGH